MDKIRLAAPYELSISCLSVGAMALLNTHSVTQDGRTNVQFGDSLRESSKSAFQLASVITWVTSGPIHISTVAPQITS